MNGHFLLSIMYLVNDVHTCDIRYASSHAYCMHAAFKGDIEAMERKLSVLRDAQTDLMDLRDRRQDSEVYKSLVTAYKKDIEVHMLYV